MVNYLKLLGGTMGKFIDRSGHTYGKLKVLHRTVGIRKDKVYWKCLCVCGNLTVVVSGDLATQHTLSCGCHNIEVTTKHGGTGKASYNTWRAMIRRCTNPNDKDYPRYNGRGITVDKAWLDYSTFALDMGEPAGDQTLDRIDNNKGYCKQNCRWASLVQQARNKTPKQHKYGVPGIKPTKSGKWVAIITANGKKKYSRVVQTLDEAITQRKALEAKYWA